MVAARSKIDLDAQWVWACHDDAPNGLEHDFAMSSQGENITAAFTVVNYGPADVHVWDGENPISGVVVKAQDLGTVVARRIQLQRIPSETAQSATGHTVAVAYSSTPYDREF